MNVALNEIIFNKKIVLCPTTRLDLFSNGKRYGFWCYIHCGDRIFISIKQSL